MSTKWIKRHFDIGKKLTKSWWQLPTCMYLWIYQDACFPSFTDSTVVLARPTISPPANTHGSLVCIVSGSTSGTPHLLNFIGFKASFTVKNTEDNRQWLIGISHTIIKIKKSYTLIIILGIQTTVWEDP